MSNENARNERKPSNNQSDSGSVSNALLSADPFAHSVSVTCGGETCACGAAATHKVGEEIPHDKPEWNQRHNWTAYVCCECFGRIMGPVVRMWCGIEDVDRDRFEAWYRQQGSGCIEDDEITASLGFDDELDEYDEPEVNLLWRAWCAAIGK